MIEQIVPRRSVLAIGLILGVFSLLIISAPKASAASPQFLITWQAQKSYTPSWFTGKALPGISTPITASFELVSPNGSLINVKSQTVYWYLNGNLIAGGVGIQHVTFVPYGAAPATMELKVELPDYSTGLLLHTIEIPLVQPKAVIQAIYPNNQFPGTTANVKAVPFFFASANNQLTYSWIVNGVPAHSNENPDSAQINLPSDASVGTTLSTVLMVTNPNDNTAGQSLLNLTYGGGGQF